MNWLEFSYFVNFDIVFEYDSIVYNIIFANSVVTLYKAPGIELISYPYETKEKILDYPFNDKYSLKQILLSEEVELIDYIEEP